MKKFKNRKYVKNVKNVNNAVKNNANMDGFEELVKAAKEFKGALDDEVANREYERKKLAEAFEKTASNDAKKGAKAVVENPVLTIDDVINAETISDLKIFTFSPNILSSKSRGDGFYFMDSKIRPVFVAEELKEERKKNKPFWLEGEDFLTHKVEKSKKSKPASDVESLKAELENLNAHFKGVCAERDNLAACLKACEKDLKLKQDEAITMRQEAVYQFKRAEKAEAFIKKLDGACDLIKKHIAAYGSKKKSK